MPIKAQGRMIKKDISNSNGFAALTPEAAVLFAMLIPHFNAHGKMNGGPGYIKDEICPKIKYLTYKNISILLKEISEHTNVKWFQHDGRYWIHSINFLTEHQDLRKDRMGPDILPDYSKSCTGGRTPEVEVEVEGKGEAEVNPGLDLGECEKAKNLPELFDRLWSKYPNKDGKKEAKRHFDATVKTEKDVSDITNALENYLKSEKVLKGYIKNGSTWFNNWRDWIPTAVEKQTLPWTEEELLRIGSKNLDGFKEDN